MSTHVHISGLAISERIYRRLLILLPNELRTSHGQDAVEVFRDLYRVAFQRAGRRGVLKLWARSLVQLVACAVREWFGRSTRRPPRPPRRSNGKWRDITEALRQDMRYGVRSYARKPGFSLTAILIIVAGVGATTAVFSVVDGVLLRRLPYPDPDRLVFFDHGSHSIPDLVDFRDRTSSFSEMAGGWDRDVDLTGTGPPERLRGALVTEGFFDILGAKPLVGRLFVQDDFVGAPRVVVLSHGLWQRRWGADRDVVGKRITLDNEPIVVAGVMSPRFKSPRVLVGSNVDVWYPFDIASPEYQSRGWHILGIVARLNTGATIEGTQPQLDILAEVMAEELPDWRRYRNGNIVPIEILPLHEATVGDVGPTLYMLFGAVGLMLLIACANLANLFLACGADRTREIALRAALGASRRRIVAQLLNESVLLALVGGAGGVALAYLAVSAFAVFNPGGIPRAETVTVDIRILLFALAISVLTGVLFGALPAVSAARADVNVALKDASGTTDVRRGPLNMRSILVVAEIAMALVLLIGAGLLFNSFVRLQRVHPGFETEES